MNIIILVTVNPEVAQLLKYVLKKKDHKVVRFRDTASAFSYLADHPAKLVLSDYRLAESDLNGDEFLTKVIETYPNTAGLLMSGSKKFLQPGSGVSWPFEHISKPFPSVKQFVAQIKSLCGN